MGIYEKFQGWILLGSFIFLLAAVVILVSIGNWETWLHQRAATRMVAAKQDIAASTKTIVQGVNQKSVAVSNVASQVEAKLRDDQAQASKARPGDPPATAGIYADWRDGIERLRNSADAASPGSSGASEDMRQSSPSTPDH